MANIVEKLSQKIVKCCAKIATEESRENKSMRQEHKIMDDADFSEIETGNGIDRNLAATANDRIKKAVIEVNELTTTIKKFNEQSSKQTDKLVKLTWWIVGLTIVMVVGLVIQIVLVL